MTSNSIITSEKFVVQIGVHNKNKIYKNISTAYNILTTFNFCHGISVTSATRCSFPNNNAYHGVRVPPMLPVTLGMVTRATWNILASTSGIERVEALQWRKMWWSNVPPEAKNAYCHLYW